MVDASHKLPIDTLIELTERLQTSVTGASRISKGNNTPLAIELFIDREPRMIGAFEALNYSINSTSRMLKLGTVLHAGFIDRYIEAIDEIQSALEPSELVMDGKAYLSKHFPVQKIHRLHDISALHNDEKSEMAKKLTLEDLELATNQINENLGLLNVPSAVAGYLTSEINHIRKIIDCIEELGQQDAWARVYFGGETIENYALSQGEEVYAKIKQNGSFWKKSVFWIAALSGFLGQGIGFVADSNQAYQLLPEKLKTEIREVYEQVQPLLIEDQSETGNNHG